MAGASLGDRSGHAHRSHHDHRVIVVDGYGSRVKNAELKGIDKFMAGLQKRVESIKKPIPQTAWSYEYKSVLDAHRITVP